MEKLKVDVEYFLRLDRNISILDSSLKFFYFLWFDPLALPVYLCQPLVYYAWIWLAAGSVGVLCIYFS